MITVKIKQKSTDGFIENDLRGKHETRPKRIPESVTERVRQHIESFPKVESHYCRQTTTKEYLEEGLNIRKMYSLYLDWMKEISDQNICSESYYRHIFTSCYNLDFYMPKKDQCDDCVVFNNLPDDEKENARDAYNEHINNKNTARQLMNNDKEEAEKNLEIHAATFDLEKVLTMPRSESSSFFYKRKVSLYNFTIYDLVTREGFCFVWDETIGKRGANEISSCLWSHINDKTKNGQKKFHFYSDNCGGQNRNNILYTMYAKAAVDFEITVTHRYYSFILYLIWITINLFIFLYFKI